MTVSLDIKPDSSDLAACPSCDLLTIVPPLPDSHYLACKRCGAKVKLVRKHSVERVLILSLSGLFLYLPAMLLPLMALSAIGLTEDGNILETSLDFFHNGYYFVSLMVLVTAVIIPFLKLFIPFTLALFISLNKSYKVLKSLLIFLKHLDEWGMVEVYLLGILVTLIKMGDLASISYDYGFFCFIGLVLLSISTIVCLDYDLFWQHLDAKKEAKPTPKIRFILAKLKTNPDLQITAETAGLIRCHDCGMLIEKKKDSKDYCSRCSSRVHSRKPSSINRTWALVITSLILFIPANTLPIMRVDYLGIPDRSTILDGIIYFFKEGSYGIGLIILVASILVPLFKIIGILINLVTIHLRVDHFLSQKTKMFRFIEFIGRWSMLDIFVIAILSVLVDFGFLTSIHTAPGATYFCMVVVLTMSAAIVFDPRIMWDRCTPTPSPNLHALIHHE